MQNNLKKKILNYDIYFDKTGVLFIEQTKTIVLLIFILAKLNL